MLSRLNKDGKVSKKYLKHLDSQPNWFHPIRTDREYKKSRQENTEFKKEIEQSPNLSLEIKQKILNKHINPFNIYQYEPIELDQVLKYYDQKLDLSQIPIFLDQVKGSLPYISPNERTESKYFLDKVNVVHIGQRKLLMTEVLFLSMYQLQSLPKLDKKHLRGHLPKNKKTPIVIYAGAGPGTHLLMLANIFPGVVFHNYDATKFDTNLVKAKHKLVNNFLYQKLFLQSEIDYYTKLGNQGYQIYFMSDIRSCSGQSNGLNNYHMDIDFEQHVHQDNQLMEQFVTQIKPISTLFKFRLPFDQTEYNYLDGRIMLQPWSKINSTESRLIIENLNNDRQKIYSKKIYSKEEYQNSFCYLNQTIKTNGFFNHSIPCSGFYPYDVQEKNNYKFNAIGFDHSYNCSFELLAWCCYLGYDYQTFNNQKHLDKFITHHQSKLINLINRTTSIICRNMRINGQGMLPNKTMLEKLEFFTNPEEGDKFHQRKKTLKNQQHHQG